MSEKDVINSFEKFFKNLTNFKPDDYQKAQLEDC